MIFALSLHFAHNSDSFICFLQSHLFSSSKRVETSDLEDLSCVGCFSWNLLKAHHRFLFFRCPYFSLSRGSLPVFLCFFTRNFFVPFSAIRSLTHPRRSPEPGWPSCHSWCGSPCQFFFLILFLSLALGVMRDFLFSTLSIFSFPVFYNFFQVLWEIRSLDFFENFWRNVFLESASDIAVCASV